MQDDCGVKTRMVKVLEAVGKAGGALTQTAIGFVFVRGDAHALRCVIAWQRKAEDSMIQHDTEL